MYVGRVLTPDTAEQVLADGHADLVGMARATIADPAFVRKALDGFDALIRPCIGANDCIDRRVVEVIEFGCSSNPQAGREHLGALPATTQPRNMLVVGGGPAGMEAAALLAERGHRVSLWECEAHLGGQLALAAKLRMNHRYNELIGWQAQRLDRLGVDVRVSTRATLESVDAGGFDVVIAATGAVPRVPDIKGVDLPHVCTVTALLRGDATVRGHILVVSEDDRAAPLSVADHLSGLGHRVTVVYRTTAPSPLVGKYSIGAILARLDEEGNELIAMSRVVSIEPGRVVIANSYSDRRRVIEGIDSVVLATGAQGDDSLYVALRNRRNDVHILGDAYAPRRIVFATRQAWHLAEALG